MQAWMLFGVFTLVDSMVAKIWGDPRVSYGFKEMYCDRLPYKTADQPADGTVFESPRQTVYRVLTRVLDELAEVR